MITTREAAQRRGVTPRRIRQHIAAGELAATKIGRDWMVDERSLRVLPRRRPGRQPKGGA